jgi:hypothetical protein
MNSHSRGKQVEMTARDDEGREILRIGVNFFTSLIDSGEKLNE